jgi:hypothetical protein
VRRDLIRYALSLPISVAVVGMGNCSTLADRVAAQRATLHGFIRDHDDA